MGRVCNDLLNPISYLPDRFENQPLGLKSKDNNSLIFVLIQINMYAHCTDTRMYNQITGGYLQHDLST